MKSNIFRSFFGLSKLPFRPPMDAVADEGTAEKSECRSRVSAKLCCMALRLTRASCQITNLAQEESCPTLHARRSMTSALLHDLHGPREKTNQAKKQSASCAMVPLYRGPEAGCGISERHLNTGLVPRDLGIPSEDRKSTRLNSSHSGESRMPSSA